MQGHSSAHQSATPDENYESALSGDMLWMSTMLISPESVSASNAVMNIKEIFKDNQVNFFRYRQGVMYYTGTLVPASADRRGASHTTL
jgi:hypothetical protein